MKMLLAENFENACKLAAATDNEMVAIQKNDMNVANSILETMSEQNISDLVWVFMLSIMFIARL